MITTTFDAAAQALYVRVRQGQTADTVPVSDRVFADLGADRLVLGFEVVGVADGHLRLSDVERASLAALDLPDDARAMLAAAPAP